MIELGILAKELIVFYKIIRDKQVNFIKKMIENEI